MPNDLRTFDGAVAIVTGAGSGIGQAISEALARRRCQVVLTDIDLADAEAVAAGIRERGGRASAKRLDVSRYAPFHELVNDTVGELRRLDYLFNNAGIGVSGEVADYTVESWERIVGVNLMGVVHGVQAAYPVMLRQGFGHIINTASMAGLTLSAGMVSYATTKHAVVALSLGLRAEAHARGVRVSALCPGVIRTPLLEGGKHGIFLGRVPLERQRELARAFFERFRPMPASELAEKTLDRVARNTPIIILPVWWRLLWWMTRLSPALALLLARQGVERGRAMLGEPAPPQRLTGS